MEFDAKRFEEFLRFAGNALDDACDELNKAKPGDIAAPGPDYLLAKIEIAMSIIESELPELKAANMLKVVDAMLSRQA
jgi:hypothetical protein